MSDKIAFIKTGWSEDYCGGPVFGNYKHVRKYREAHERFNFLSAPDGRFYGYAPPIGENEVPPKPTEKEGWLVIFVAKRPGRSGLFVVGWYVNATFHHDYLNRPEYAKRNSFESDVHGHKYGYCISADSGRMIPAAERELFFSGTHFKRAPVIYVSGVGKNEQWRQELAAFAKHVINFYSNSDSGNYWGGAGSGFPSQEHIKKVEKAAIGLAEGYLRKEKYEITDKQKHNCGYDLLAKRKDAPSELHVEVKGTSGERMRFYMSRNEYMYMPNPKWRLLMVTEALSTDPKVQMLTRAQVEKMFDFRELSFEATLK